MPRTKKNTTETVKAAKTVAAAAKTTVAAKAAEAKTVVDNTAAEVKTTVKRAACKTTVCVEMNGLSVAVADIQNAVKKDIKARGLVPAEVKIYINAQEQAAYYTADGKGSAEYKVDLKTL